MVIESNSNPIVKEVRKLKDKKYREKNRCFVMEGVASLKDIPQDIKVRFFVVSEGKEQKYYDIIGSTKYYIVTEKIFESLSDTVTTSGLLAVIDYFDKELSCPKGDSLILDGISDPGNLGTLIRTAVAMNITDIYLASCCDLFSPKVLRSTMGGIFRGNFYRGTIEEVLSVHKDNTIYSMDMSGKDLFTIKFEDKSTIIVGSEAHGLSDVSRNRADKIISLPTENGMESLNAAVAGGIALYFLSRK